MRDQTDNHASQAELDLLGDQCNCSSCRLSVAARVGPRVMFEITPVPGESLVGLISRVCRRNHLPSLRAFLAACTDVEHAQLNLARRDEIDFTQLAYAARLSPHAVEDRRYRTVSLTRDVPGVDYHGAIIPAYDLNLRYRRSALSWLIGEPFHSALGHHALVTHCPVSGNIIFDQCLRCGARLNWSKLELANCAACGCDLKMEKSQLVSAGDASSTRLMLDLIHPDSARNQAASALLPGLLSGLNRGTVFELGWRLGALFAGGAIGKRSDAQRLPVTTRLRILATGSMTLASWPGGVRSAMQGINPDGGVLDPKLPNAVRSIAKAANAWPEITSAIFAAVPGLADSARMGIRSVLNQPANGAELTRGLGVSQRLFERMRDADIFAPVSTSGAVNLHQIFDAAHAERLRSVLASCIPLAAASERFGISNHGVEQLCCLGELDFLSDKSVSTAFKNRQISKASLESLKCRLEKAAIIWLKSSKSEGELMPIRRAVRAIGGKEKPWGPIVVAMLDGKLPIAIDANSSRRLMDRISIPAGRLQAIAMMSFDAEFYPKFAFDQRLNRRDAEELLNINPPTFSRATKNGEIPSPVSGLYDRLEVLALAMRRLSVSEALTRWTLGGQQLPAPLKGKGAPIRAGKLGWNRDLVEEMMQEWLLYSDGSAE